MVIFPLFGLNAPTSILTTVLFPQPLSPTIAVIPFSGNVIDTFLSTSRVPSYENVTPLSSIDVLFTSCVPHTGSGVLSNDMIFLPALTPFIATWNAEPNARSGKKLYRDKA